MIKLRRLEAGAYETTDGKYFIGHGFMFEPGWTITGPEKPYLDGTGNVVVATLPTLKEAREFIDGLIKTEG